MVPAPYCPAGITPSNSRYSKGWSSVRTASRFSWAVKETPLGMAHEIKRLPTPVASRSGADWLHGAAVRIEVATRVMAGALGGDRLVVRECVENCVSGGTRLRGNSCHPQRDVWRVNRSSVPVGSMRGVHFEAVGQAGKRTSRGLNRPTALRPSSVRTTEPRRDALSTPEIARASRQSRPPRCGSWPTWLHATYPGSRGS